MRCFVTQISLLFPKTIFLPLFVTWLFILVHACQDKMHCAHILHMYQMCNNININTVETLEIHVVHAVDFCQELQETNVALTNIVLLSA